MPAEDDVERTVFRKVTLRLMPFLGLLYFFNILDRANIDFARLQMLDDAGISKWAYGLGAGLVGSRWRFYAGTGRDGPRTGYQRHSRVGHTSIALIGLVSKRGGASSGPAARCMAADQDAPLADA